MSDLDIKVKEFVLKCVHNVLVTRKKLFEWKLSQGKNCLLCRSGEETLEHLPIQCDAVVDLKFVEQDVPGSMDANFAGSPLAWL